MMSREETTDYIQNLSLKELKNWCEGGTPVNIIWTDDVSDETTDEVTAEYIQSLSIEELKSLFKNGQPVQINWAEDTSDEEEDFAKSSSNGLTTKTYTMPEKTVLALHEDAEPIPILVTKGTRATSEKIWAIMDLTDLDYESVEKILFEPKRAVLGDIAVYCKRLNINFLEFIGKALA